MNKVIETKKKVELSFWQIWNMSFGFLGVQYAFGLQQANMSPIYRYLGAEEKNLPMLWLAGPVTGLLIQPIIGAMSDRTWTRLGRRRPYFLVGAILTSVALIFMPFSSSVWMAAGLMWLLDGAANITMEPFRAFIADKLPEKQRPLGFSMQSFFVGFGQILATLMPLILGFFGVAVAAEATGASHIPDYVKYPFLIGAVVLLFSVLWTIYTTNENPPEDIEAFKRLKAGKSGLAEGFKEVVVAFKEMPKTMKQLWWVKFFTWYGLPLMWQYLGLSIARHSFNAASPEANPEGFKHGVEYGVLGLTMFNIACVAISFLLPYITRYITGSRRATHALCLVIGGVGFVSMLFTNDVKMFMVCMLLVGVAWASIMAMPYVMLASSVPEGRMGVYMGIFNMFIVVPQIINMITIPFLYKSLLGDDPRNALVLAGVCLICAAVACFLVDEPKLEEDAAATFVGGGGGH